MYSRFSALALRWARVRPEPEPPVGASGSAKTFRAGPNYYYVRLLRWGAGQIGATIGILFSIGFTEGLQHSFDRAVAARDAPRVTASPAPKATQPSPESPPKAIEQSLTPVASASPTSSASSTPSSRRSRNRLGSGMVTRAVAQTPRWVVDLAGNWFIPFLVFLEYLGIAAFLVQLPLTYALARIEFEQHWYIVTDRSLRIRTGVLSLSESTMSFANLQQVEVKQGPIQRLLGLADVRVRSAGGGHGSHEDEGEGLHTGVFHSVANAPEIRDLMLARLRAFREAGIGDPDRSVEPTKSVVTGTTSPEALTAAREVLSEARALRLATTNGPNL